MGMFDKDKEIGLLLERFAPEREAFILWNVKIGREDYPTVYGPATQTLLYCSRLDAPGDEFEVSTLASAIGDKARDAEEGDFPAVVHWERVATKRGAAGTALVLQFLKPYSPPRGG